MDDMTLKLLEHTGRGGWRYFWHLANRQSDWWQGQPPEPRSTTDVYFGVHPTAGPRGVFQRSTIETVAAVNCLFAEWDSATAAQIENLRLPPTVLVRSSTDTRHQGYWLLSETVPVTNANRQALRSLQHRFVELVGSDDGAKDLARILRLPGTFNGKHSPPMRVEFVWYDEGDNFRLESLQQHVDHWAPAAQPERPPAVVVPAAYTGDEFQARAYAETALDNELRDLALTPPGGRNNQLNEAAFSLAQLVAGGLLTQHEVVQGLYTTALSIGLGEAETKATIASGFRKGYASPRGIPNEQHRRI
jgi:hypothetical protein